MKTFAAAITVLFALTSCGPKIEPDRRFLTPSQQQMTGQSTENFQNSPSRGFFENQLPESVEDKSKGQPRESVPPLSVNIDDSIAAHGSMKVDGLGEMDGLKSDGSSEPRTQNHDLASQVRVRELDVLTEKNRGDNDSPYAQTHQVALELPPQSNHSRDTRAGDIQARGVQARATQAGNTRAGETPAADTQAANTQAANTQAADTQEFSDFPSTTVLKGKSIPYGQHDRGKLIDGVQLPLMGIGYKFIGHHQWYGGHDYSWNWGTEELVQIIQKGAQYLVALSTKDPTHFPPGPPLQIAELAKQNGGKTGPDGQKSHQNGLDADVSYPTQSTKNKLIDYKRLWELFKFYALLPEVSNIYVGPSIKTALCRYVVAIGEYSDSPNEVAFHALAFLDRDSRHNSHFHLRLECPQRAQGVCKKPNIVASRPGC